MGRNTYVTTFYTCNRCGEEKLYEDHDNAYVDGWRNAPGLDLDSMLCPHCAKLYYEMMGKFMLCTSFSMTAGVKLGEEEEGAADENSI